MEIVLFFLKERAEGGYTLEQFRKVWIKINGKWDPDEIVTVYEFKKVEKTTLDNLKNK